MFTRTKTISVILLMLGALLLTACGGSDVESGEELLSCDVPLVPDDSGTSCVEPEPIDCDPPTVPDELNETCIVGYDETMPDPVYFPEANEAVLYYNRGDVDASNDSDDPVYDGYRLHTWNNDACSAYADADTSWSNGREFDGIDPNYGAYWIVELKDDHDDCGNFIIHTGTDDAGKEMGGADFTMPLAQDDDTWQRVNFTFSGIAVVYEYPITSLGEQPVAIEDRAAHWLDVDTLVWAAGEDVTTVKLHYSMDADLAVDEDSGEMNGTAIELTEVELTDAQKAINYEVDDKRAFAGSWDADDAKAILKGQIALAGYNSEGTLVSATYVQTPNVLDALYTSGDNDANEAQLGAVYNDDDTITVSLWAPTAQDVNLLLYGSDKVLASTIAMAEDTDTGIWSYTGSTSELDRVLYRFGLTVYHYDTNAIEELWSTDPYSVSLAMNGRFSQFVNLDDTDLLPDGWSTQTIPTIENPEDAVIYEGHIRDFSVRDESTSAANRGKYLAFTESDSAPMQHLKKLVDSGLTHFHMLPANDMATVNENTDQTVDFDSSLSALCLLNSSTKACNDGTDTSLTIGEAFASFDPYTDAPADQQQLATDMKDDDTFNWGYDPQHYSVPEGSYATEADGVERIVEMRQMIMALHELGLRVVLDVVYNHTASSSTYSTSVLDKVVPGYYHRYDVDTGSIIQETCCEDTEPRNAMMAKLMKDSLLLWTEEYKFDSFRFDIMSHASKDLMLSLRDAVQAVDPDNYFYGEGWTREDHEYEQANQSNMAGTSIGTFNDRIRDAIRGTKDNPVTIFADDWNNASAAQLDKVKLGLAGTLSDYVLETYSGTDSEGSNLGGYASDPADIINYVSKHDNETLWDIQQYTLPESISLENRVRAANISAALPLMAQGIPFLQLGGDFLRSKSMDRDSYNSGDWFNYVDFTYQTNNWNVGLPVAEKNEYLWDTISLYLADSERAATNSDIEFASDVFAEFLKIRTSSKLFRLTSADEIINRVGFHNIGSNQTEGLIVMSIDDGVNDGADYTLEDLDSNYDAIVVVVNSGYEEKSLTVATATGFALHSVQQSSVDSTVTGASFTEGDDEGTFTVPAMTMAVFVKAQGESQGYGLSAYATSGAPDVVPYGDTTVYVRGLITWDAVDAFTYQGDGLYTIEFDLVAGTTYEFKVADADWSSINYGGDSVTALTEDDALALTYNGNNLTFTPTVDGTYIFTLNAYDPSAPSLTVENEEPFVGTAVYLRGSLNSWGTDNEMIYQGDRIYTTSITLDAGSYEFKVASSDWTTVDYGAADGTAVTLGEDLALGKSGANMTISISDAGTYAFIFDMSDEDAPVIRVFNQQFFGDTTVYVKGGMNSWSNTNALTYEGDGVYATTISLSVQSYEFKLADADWAVINLGGGDETTVTVGEAFQLTGGSNPANLSMDISEAGTYRFEVTGPDASAPYLTVTKVE